MTLLFFIIGLSLFIAIAVFLLYAYLAVQHATRFRYLSKRMLFLTLTFVASTTILISLTLISYVFFVMYS